LRFIKTHDAKEPRVVLGKDRSTKSPRSHRSYLCELGGKRENIYIVMRLPIVRFLYASLGL
jgi:hypothetical protein